MKMNFKKVGAFCLIITLLLLIPISAGEYEEVYVGGMPFGIRFEVGEVVVLKTNSFISNGKNVNPAEEAGIITNDIIVSIDEKKINSSFDVINAVKASKNDVLKLVLKRSDKEIKAEICPKVSDISGEKQLGVILKDSSAGIGTVTFVNQDSLIFAGLGHGICDNQSGDILKIDNGYISDVAISGINKGKCGTPGELHGIIDTKKSGKLLSNTDVGIFGVFTEGSPLLNTKIEIANSDEVSTGDATILCTLDDNKREEYKIEISQIHHGALAKTKNYVVKVTDERLLEKTGGIVQGMSGSPIIQNGKLVGAITHVMINDPTTGYGIFIGNMLNELKKIV